MSQTDQTDQLIIQLKLELEMYKEKCKKLTEELAEAKKLPKGIKQCRRCKRFVSDVWQHCTECGDNDGYYSDS